MRSDTLLSHFEKVLVGFPHGRVFVFGRNASPKPCRCHEIVGYNVMLPKEFIDGLQGVAVVLRNEVVHDSTLHTGTVDIEFEQDIVVLASLLLNDERKKGRASLKILPYRL